LFEFSSIEQYHSQLQEGRCTCLQVVEHYLQKIKENAHLNAFIKVYADEAREKASLLDKQRDSNIKTGKLAGVIISIKDVIAYKDHPLTSSSKILEGFESLYSATAVDRLLAEDAILIGSTNCDEFGMGSANEHSVYGPVKNYLDITRTPGGSSGGSAVSVQAGLSMVSLGSDTGGSVRQPADHCGIIGLKPGYGRISRYGLIAYASSFDQIGIFSKTIKDAALILEIIAGPDDYDSTVSTQQVPAYTNELNRTSNEKYKIAYLPQALDHPSLDIEIGNSIKDLLLHLEKDNHQVKAVNFDLLDFAVPTYYVLTTAEASSNLSRYDGIKYGISNHENVELTDFYKSNRSAGFGSEVKRRIMLGTFVLSTGYYDAYFTKAQQIRNLFRDQLNLVFNDFDFIIIPTVPKTASLSGNSNLDPISVYLADIYTVIANLTGIPAISLPLFTHTNTLPFGVQIMANRLNELPLLRFSNQLLIKYNADF
jgi:aspartyl-tRNA(Asn)/glutamyl-tRNA(Gln) amidotransferase subunit A